MPITSIRERFTSKIQNNNLSQKNKSFKTAPYACDSFQKTTSSVSFSGKTAYVAYADMQKPKDIADYVRNASQALLDGNLGTAEAHLEHALTNTKSPEIHFLRGLVEHEKGLKTESTDKVTAQNHFEKAMEHYNQAIKHSGLNQRALIAANMQKVDLHKRNGNIPDAINAFETAFEFRKSYNPDWDNKEEPFTKLTQDMVMIGREALSQSYHEKAYLYAQNKDFENARKSLSASLYHNRKNSDSYSLRGYIFKLSAFAQEKEKYKEKYLRYAEKDLKNAIKYAPKDASGIKNLAELYKVWGKNEKALKTYKMFLKLQPENEDARLSEGLLYMLSNKKIDAIDDFNLVLRKNSENQTAKRYKEIAEEPQKIDKTIKTEVHEFFIADMFRKLAPEASAQT